MDVTASQIRQDLNYFGGFGQQGYGYSVEHLHHEIGKLLGVNSGHKTIIVGAGNLGHALANYQGIINRRVSILAMFDVSADKIGKSISNIPILSMDEMDTFVKENNIDIAILTLPRDNVVGVFNRLKDCGIKGFWNFTAMELDTEEGVPVENVHLTDSLMTLAYKVNNQTD